MLIAVTHKGYVVIGGIHLTYLRFLFKLQIPVNRYIRERVIIKVEVGDNSG